MKIKHFMGYGSVNAKVVEKGNGYLIINVWGNHEYGLFRNNEYDVNQWLVKKVARKNIDYKNIYEVKCDYINNIDKQEAVQYVIKYRD